MGQSTTIEIELAKKFFQFDGVYVRGVAVLKRKIGRGHVLAFLARRDPCPDGMEARA